MPSRSRIRLSIRQYKPIFASACVCERSYAGQKKYRHVLGDSFSDLLQFPIARAPNPSPQSDRAPATSVAVCSSETGFASPVSRRHPRDLFQYPVSGRLRRKEILQMGLDSSRTIANGSLSHYRIEYEEPASRIGVSIRWS
jgi:hypothetical protein